MREAAIGVMWPACRLGAERHRGAVATGPGRSPWPPENAPTRPIC